MSEAFDPLNSAAAKPAPAAKGPSWQAGSGGLSGGSSWPPVVVAGVGGALALLLLVAGLVVLWMKGGSQETPPAVIAPDPIAVPGVDDDLPRLVANPPPWVEPSTPSQPPSSTDILTPSHTSAPNGHATNPVNPAVVAPTSPNTSQLAGDPKPITSLKPQVESSDEPEPKKPSPSFFPPATEDTRLPIPAEADLAARREQIDELFPIGSAKTSQQKTNLARTMLKTGRESKDDPAAQYVLFNQAQTLASGAGNVTLAFEAIDELDKRFQVEGDALRMDGIKNAAGARTTPTERSQSVAKGIELVDRMMQQDRFVEAAKLIAMLQGMARKSSDRDQSRKLVDQKKLGSELYRAYRDARDAIESLKTDPTNAAAASVAGRYFVFAKGDWQLGLPMLAAGDDEALKAVAAQEMAPPASTPAQRKLADAWRQLAENSSGIEARRQYARAVMWYRRIENQLTGLTKVSVQNHLKKIGDIDVDGGLPYRVARTEPVKPIEPATPPAGKPIDLLARINTTRDAVRGEWEIADDGALVAHPGPLSRIQVPFKPPESYVLELEVTRTAGKMDLAIGLVYRGTPCQVIIDGWGGTSCGITAAQRGRNIATGQKVHTSLTNGRRCKIKCTVGRDLFVVECDGREILRHVGPPQWDSMNPGWRVPNPTQLMLGTNQSNYRFHSLSLSPSTPRSLPPKPPVPAAPLPRGTVDLLASIDVQKHKVVGEWIRNGPTLVSPSMPFARVVIPVRPPAEYDVELVLTSTKQRSADLAIGVIYQGRPCTVVLDRAFGRFSTLTGTRRGAPVKIQQRDIGPLLPFNERRKVTCIVRRNKLSVQVDGAEVLSFAGNATWDGAESAWKTPDANAMMLGAFVSTFEIHSMRLVPVRSSGGRR